MLNGSAITANHARLVPIFAVSVTGAPLTQVAGKDGSPILRGLILTNDSFALLIRIFLLSLPSAADDMDGNGKMDARSMSMSMSSVGKVVYESVHRGAGGPADVQQQSHQETIANQRNNLVYCPSPYATTRVSLFFPGSSGNHSSRGSDGHQTSAMSSEQNCYDMPIIKPVCAALYSPRSGSSRVRDVELFR